MGYTHYFEHQRAFTDAEWQQATTAVRKIVEHPDCPPVQYEDDDDRPALADVAEDTIRFNGVGADGHETFVVKKDEPGFAFCKTAYKPYDSAVVASLCAIERFAPGALELGSDGSPDDWSDGCALANKALRGGVPNPRAN